MQKTCLKRFATFVLAFFLLTGHPALLAEEMNSLEDRAVEAYQAYLGRATALLEQPAMDAPTLAVIPAGSRVLVMADYGEYLLVNAQVAAATVSGDSEQAGDDGLQDFEVREELAQSDAEDGAQDFSEPVMMEGYIPLENLARPEKMKAVSRIAYTTETSVTYTDAHEYAYTAHCLPAGSLVCVDGISGPFSHIKEMDVYVYTSTLKKLGAKQAKAAVGFSADALPLYGVKEGAPTPLGVEVPANTLLDMEWTYRDWYCVFYGGNWGLVGQSGFKKLKAVKLPNAIPAVLREGTPLLAEPIAPGQPSGKTVQKDTPVWVTETINAHVAVADSGELLFVPYSDLLALAEVKKVPEYEGYVEFGAPLLDFPDARVGARIGEAPANSLVTIKAQNQEYALVESDDSKRYIALKDFVSLDKLFAEPDRLENYYILISKAERELTVYLADAQGMPTDTVLQQAKVAIGRRTMPTPVGTFKLSLRQRWRSFAPRFAPFAIQFTTWKRKLFIHGPMCFYPDDNTISRNALLEFGQQKTSGCVRVPYDVMLWIYCHCGPDNTVVEIIGGKT